MLQFGIRILLIADKPYSVMRIYFRIGCKDDAPCNIRQICGAGNFLSPVVCPLLVGMADQQKSRSLSSTFLVSSLDVMEDPFGKNA